MWEVAQEFYMQGAYNIWHGCSHVGQKGIGILEAMGGDGVKFYPHDLYLRCFFFNFRYYCV